jgi:hypothetical protein
MRPAQILATPVIPFFEGNRVAARMCKQHVNSERILQVITIHNALFSFAFLSVVKDMIVIDLSIG